MGVTEDLRDYLNTEEGKKSLEEHAKKFAQEMKMHQSQLERFHEKYADNLAPFIEKTIEKYESDVYNERERKRGIEPRMPLHFFLFEYAERYGRKATEEEEERYGNMFTAGLYYVAGYYFNLMMGQGSHIQVFRGPEALRKYVLKELPSKILAQLEEKELEDDHTLFKFFEWYYYHYKEQADWKEFKDFIFCDRCKSYNEDQCVCYAR